jgi:hypothetical protein
MKIKTFHITRNLQINDLIYDWFLVINDTCNLLQCLIALDKLHKLSIVKENMWHLVEKTIALWCD